MIPNPSINESNRFLNVAIESHSTTSSGRLFQNLTTLLLNACFLISRWHAFFLIFLLCPLVTCPCSTMKNLLVSVLSCLLYTSDAADERSSVDLGGRRIIKKKKKKKKNKFFFFSSRRRHTRCSGVSWARRCV